MTFQPQNDDHGSFPQSPAGIRRDGTSRDGASPELRPRPSLALLTHAAVMGAFAAVVMHQPPTLCDADAVTEVAPSVVDAAAAPIDMVEVAMSGSCQIVVDTVPGSTLALHRVTTAGRSESGHEARSVAVASSSGTHRFTELVPGTYHATVLFPDGRIGAAPVTTCEGDEARFAYRLFPSGEPVLVSGRVTGNRGASMEHAELLLEEPHGRRSSLLGVAHIPVAADGTFSVMLPNGAYTFLALAPRHLGRTVEVTVDNSPRSFNVALVWRPEVNGRVLDADGKPVSGAVITVGPIVNPKTSPPTTVTDEDGHYVVAVPPGQDLHVAARRGRGFAVERLRAITTTDGHHDVELRLVDGHSVGGIVQDQRGAVKPFAVVTVRQKEFGILDVVNADDQGRFVVRGLPTADVEVWPKDGAIGAWGGAVATVSKPMVLLTYVAEAY